MKEFDDIVYIEWITTQLITDHLYVSDLWVVPHKNFLARFPVTKFVQHGLIVCRHSLDMSHSGADLLLSFNDE